MTVRFEGGRELEQALGDMTKSAAAGALKRVLAKAALPIFETAQALIPVHGADAHPSFKINGKRIPRKAGTQKKLLAMGPRLTKRQASTAKKEGKNFAEYYVGERDPAARLVEFGTSQAIARPFLRPAWDNEKGEALNIIQREIGDEIAKSAERAAKKAARLAAKNGG